MKYKAFFHRESKKGEAFRLLSEFYRLPKEDLAFKLKVLEKRMDEACSRAVPYITKMRAYFEEDGDMESLMIEFSKLFVGPFRLAAPPYGSVYLDGDRVVMGKSTLDVLNQYKEEGLGISSSFHDAPDHIAAELEFVCFLNSKALEAAENSDRDSQTHYLEKRERFLKNHLGAWISDFERHVERNAETDFYKNLVSATKALIQKDMEILSEIFSHLRINEFRNQNGGNHDAFR
jgi:TorA maturation chaperone TorD